MVRVNLINPQYLTDEHLYAENVELQMLTTFINKYPDGEIPDSYRLGKGHMSFFRNKPNFIKYRINLITKEINKRSKLSSPLNIKHGDLEWIPDNNSISINIRRITDRLMNPLKKTNPWHYYGNTITDIEKFVVEFLINVGKENESKENI